MDKWNHWVTTQISEKGLSIELVLEWSKVRVGFAVAVSIAMSLVGGFAYQFTTGDTQTAWTIGGYMMTVYGFVIGYAAWVSTVETR